MRPAGGSSPRRLRGRCSDQLQPPRPANPDGDRARRMLGWIPRTRCSSCLCPTRRHERSPTLVLPPGRRPAAAGASRASASADRAASANHATSVFAVERPRRPPTASWPPLSPPSVSLNNRWRSLVARRSPVGARAETSPNTDVRSWPWHPRATTALEPLPYLTRTGPPPVRGASRP